MSRKRRIAVSKAVPKRERQRRTVREVDGCDFGTKASYVCILRELAKYFGFTGRLTLEIDGLTVYDGGTADVSSRLASEGGPRQPARHGRNHGDGGADSA